MTKTFILKIEEINYFSNKVKAETIEPEVKSIKPKKITVKDEIVDVEDDTDNK